ncbi:MULTISPECIES: lactococcin 972 family bacteriocin [unclassified Curtobacterium]|uniref:lactococcin 972 family bacteriocin n=1 Tax=unclassified Curtobacterium TaxID=257496 RepID=UPI000832099E|nr:MULTISPECIES: lactococcin 972 family bacteriocin [unclassified Curtobacterium]MCM3504874.1 lactococcin 972 family bacteriocin [Curtobacterium sp. ODYSSEY 48 V2]MDT0208975.1 lactococcin 972 family bacteriocin [Curtobacterium sp. BRD11]
MGKKLISIAAAAVVVAAIGPVGATAAVAVASDSPASSGRVVEGGASADRVGETRNGTAYPEGGTWTYGVWSGEVHSVYQHNGSTHRASVKSHGVVTRSAWQPPTKVAYAHRPKAVSGNQAFWARRG